MDFGKKAGIEQQMGALMTERFRITLKPRAAGLHPVNFGNRSTKMRKAKGVPERFWRVDEIVEDKVIKALTIANMQGYDIYLTPIDDAHHHIVVDDATVESLAQLKRDGFTPAVIQKSSRDNLQAILIAGKVARKDEQSLAQKVMTEINRKYGDPLISGVRHTFRLAGFWNKKEGKEDQHTVIIQASPTLCLKTTAMLENVRSMVPVSPARGAPAGGLCLSNEPTPESTAFAIYFEQHKRAATGRYAGTLDYDRLDYQSARSMAAIGYTTDQITGALLSASPHITKRHKHALRYATATAANASYK